MQIKLLNDLVGEIAGKPASDIVDLLLGKKDVNEFLISKKLKMTINQVRNILYRLSNFNLVTFTRKKDKRKGWYTYFWTLDTKKALILLENRLIKEIENLKNQLKSRRVKRFYVCNTCKTEVNEELALLNNFTCQECGEVYSLADNQKTINHWEKEIEKLERQKENVLMELEKLNVQTKPKTTAKKAKKRTKKNVHKKRKKKIKKKAKKKKK